MPLACFWALPCNASKIRSLQGDRSENHYLNLTIYLLVVYIILTPFFDLILSNFVYPFFDDLLLPGSVSGIYLVDVSLSIARITGTSILRRSVSTLLLKFDNPSPCCLYYFHSLLLIYNHLILRERLLIAFFL